MKTLKFNYLIVLLSLLTFSCVRDYDGPPLEEPTYGGDANITIAGLKERYKDVTNATLIEYEFVVKATIVGNDESGNIYKQLYIEDATGGITVGIEQNSIYATHRVGQEVYLDLHNLYILKYGGEHQIGYGNTNANRVPWQIFVGHIHFQGYPDASKAQPNVRKIDQLTDADVNTLVRFEDVYFVNGGLTTFTRDDATTEETLRDGNGNALMVRTSSYATFAKDTIPAGGGSVVGVLGRYNNSWQLMIRDLDDLDLGQDIPGGSGPGDGSDVLFSETFGEGYYPSGNRPKIAEFDDFDMKAPIVYSDDTEAADIRSISGANGAHVWLPANRDSRLHITGISTAAYDEPLTLSFQLAANLYNPTDAMNLNVLQVTVNGTALNMPSTPVSNSAGDDSKFYTFEFSDAVPAGSDVTIDFFSPTAGNTMGLRLDNIRIYRTGGTGIEL
ncbi:MAG: DUF5689 domain-containing protein [Bacteroides sp.]|nr:DUF5689 domain-containing protein [Bacteroides sp.]